MKHYKIYMILCLLVFVLCGLGGLAAVARDGEACDGDTCNDNSGTDERCYCGSAYFHVRSPLL